MDAYTKPTGLEFKTIVVSGQNDVVADKEADVLTLVAGTDISIETNEGTDTITINAIGGGGGFVSSGDPASPDMREWPGSTYDFSSVGDNIYTWYEFDLNSIAGVPTAAKAVLLYVNIQDGAVESGLEFRDSANSNDYNISGITTKVTNDWMSADVTVPITDGKIDIRSTGIVFTDFTRIDLTVKGWWL